MLNRGTVGDDLSTGRWQQLSAGGRSLGQLDTECEVSPHKLTLCAGAREIGFLTSRLDQRHLAVG